MPPWPPAKPGLDAGKWSCKDPRRLEPATWFPARPRAGAHVAGLDLRRSKPGPPPAGGSTGLRTLQVGGSEAPLGRSAPFPARPRAGARLSLKESRRKEHQGGERFSPPWTHLSLVCDQREVFSMFRDWPAAHEPTPVTARPPAGRAGRGRNFGTRCAGIPKLGDAPRTAPAKLALSG